MTKGLKPIREKAQRHKKAGEHPGNAKGKTPHPNRVGGPKRGQVDQKTPGKTQEPAQQQGDEQRTPLDKTMRHGNGKDQRVEDHDCQAPQEEGGHSPPQIQRQPVAKVAQRAQQIRGHFPAVHRTHQIIPAKDAQIGDDCLRQTGIGNRRGEIHARHLRARPIERHHDSDAQQPKEKIGRQAS